MKLLFGLITERTVKLTAVELGRNKNKKIIFKSSRRARVLTEITVEQLSFI